MLFLFFALLIALGLIQYWGSAGPVHADGWFAALRRRLEAAKLPAALRGPLAVLGPPLLLVIALGIIGDAFLSLPALAAHVLALLYSFGRGDYHGLVARYREYCRAGNFDGARLFARQELSGGAADACPADPESLHHWAKARIAYLGFERWFGPVFWFILIGTLASSALGAAAAVAYRLLRLYATDATAPPLTSQAPLLAPKAPEGMLQQALHYADWIPARLLVLTFALTGDWMGSREQVARALRDAKADNGALLSEAAHAALGLKAAAPAPDSPDGPNSGGSDAFAQISDWETSELQALLRRSMVAWVALLAAVVILG